MTPSLPSRTDAPYKRIALCPEHPDEFFYPLRDGDRLSCPMQCDGVMVPYMPVSEHETAMHQVRRFREYERWERVYEAAQALVNLKPDAFPSRCWREVVALRAALEWTDDNEED